MLTRQIVPGPFSATTFSTWRVYAINKTNLLLVFSDEFLYFLNCESFFRRFTDLEPSPMAEQAIFKLKNSRPQSDAGIKLIDNVVKSVKLFIPIPISYRIFYRLFECNECGESGENHGKM